MRSTLRVFVAFLTLGVWHPQDSSAASVPLQNATATCSQPGFSIGEAIDANATTGWAIVCNGFQTFAQTAVFETVADVSGASFTFTLAQDSPQSQPHNIGRFRLSATTDDRSLFADGLANGGDVTANWVVLDPTSVSSGTTTLTEQGDMSLLASGPLSYFDIYMVTVANSLVGITGFRLEMLTDPSLPSIFDLQGGPGRADNGNFVLTNFSLEDGPAPVPEPATVFLLGSGVAGLLAWRRRRSANRQLSTAENTATGQT